MHSGFSFSFLFWSACRNFDRVQFNTPSPKAKAQIEKNGPRGLLDQHFQPSLPEPNSAPATQPALPAGKPRPRSAMDEDAAMGDARDAEAFDPVSCPVALTYLGLSLTPSLDLPSG
jgi:hypothetical protein